MERMQDRASEAGIQVSLRPSRSTEFDCFGLVEVNPS
jgi:hypothetical protein